MKKLWKIYKYTAVIIVSVFIIDALVVLFFANYRPAIKKADAIVILGAAINTPALYNRSLEGLRLYKESKANVMVLSGGRISDKDISEAGYMKKTILANSDPSTGSGSSKIIDAIILEDQSHSTYDNIKNTKAKLGSGKSVIIVSDEYHLARGVLMAEREGFSPVYWSSPKPTYYSKTELAFYYMREVFAIIAYIPKFILG